MRRLGFIVGGVQKAGTTSLFAYLSRHPELLAPLSKELHVFDDPHLAADPHDHLSLCFPPADADRMAFEVTPIYLFWPDACARIRAYDPSMRLIFLFRDPIERAWSHWRMAVERGNETLSFAQAIREGRRRQETLSDDLQLRQFNYVERGFYGAQVARLLPLFPREQLLFLRARDLVENRAMTLNGIARFLGIGPFPELPEERERWSAPQREMAEADAAYLRGLFREDTLRFAELSGVDVGDWPTLNEEAPLWRPPPA